MSTTGLPEIEVGGVQGGVESLSVCSESECSPERLLEPTLLSTSGRMLILMTVDQQNTWGEENGRSFVMTWNCSL